MASAGGRKSADLTARLEKAPYRFDFFQIVRLLERAARQSARQSEGRASPLGSDGAPSEESVRFRAHVSLTFPPNEVVSLRNGSDSTADEASPRSELVTAFMGLVGPSGVLPHHYTRMLVERARYKDFALRDFLDLFHHRIISLFYRAWSKYRLYQAYEESSSAPEASADDLFTQALMSLVGMGFHSLRGHLEFDDQTFVEYAGHFSRQARNAVSLELLLQDHLGLPVVVEQFQAEWLELTAEDKARLMPEEPLSDSVARLGTGLNIGDRIYCTDSKFRVRVGPLNREQFRRFLPTGDRLTRLCQLVRSYAGPELDFDVQLVLRGSEVPRCHLGVLGADAAQLGRNIWIHSRSMEQDQDDAVFSGEGAPTR